MRSIRIAMMFLAAQFLTACGCTVVDPGTRGIKVELGEVTQQMYPEGLVWHKPLIATIVGVSIRQQTKEMKSECYSSDLQQVNAQLQVLYRIPEANVVTMYQKYAGDPFESLIAPRVNEALKEITSLQTAEGIVKNREKIKLAALKAARDKIGDLVYIEDIVIENVALSQQLENAIESKMVQQQEAAKAEFLKQKAQVEAETAVITAQGQANALQIQGEALKKNPETMQMEMIKKWNGVTPLVVGAGSGSNILLPIKEK